MSRFENSNFNQIGSLSGLLPLDMTQYGAVGDGATDCLPAWNTLLNSGSSDITNRLSDSGLNVDSNNDGIADNWNSYKDATVTGSLNMSADGAQQLNVTASTGTGGQGVYQDFPVTPGETITVGITYKSTVTSGSLVPYILVYATGGSSIKSFTLSNSSAYSISNSSQFLVPTGVTSIRLYFMARSQVSGDTGSITIKNVTLTLAVDLSKRIIKFPQNKQNSAVYYFSTTPTLDNLKIDCDDGVTLSFPSTNGISWKKVTFYHDIKITSRDRNNTGTMLTDNYSKFIYKSLMPNPIEVGMKRVQLLDTATLQNVAYYTAGGTVTTGLSFPLFDSSRNLVKVGDTAQATNTGKLNITQLSFTNGTMYNCLFSQIAPEINNTVRAGVLFGLDSENFLLYSVDCQGHVYKGIRYGGLWTETQNKYSVTSAYYLLNPFIMSARPISANKVEIYINGALFDTVTVSFNATNLGFGINTVNATGVGILNNVWGNITYSSVTQSHIGNTLSAVVFGDSITFGEGCISWAEFLPNLIEGQRGITTFNVTNIAVSGETAAQQYTRMQGVTLSNYDIVLILVGTNDIQQANGYVAFGSTIQNMINLAKNNGCRLVIGIPPMFISQSLTGQGYATANFDKGAHIRAKILELCATNNVILADTLGEIGRIGTDNALTLLRDNIHPTVSGQLYLARCFARSIMYSLDN